jgi:hypothetical protein
MSIPAGLGAAMKVDLREETVLCLVELTAAFRPGHG